MSCNVHVCRPAFWFFAALVLVCYFPFPPFAFLCAFSWDLKSLVYAPCVRPCVNIAPIGICKIDVLQFSCLPFGFLLRSFWFATFLLVCCARLGPIIYIPTHKYPPWVSIVIPTHYAKHDMLLLVLAYFAMCCILGLRACFVCLPACFGMLPLHTCPNPNPEPVRLCCCHCAGIL